MGGDGVYYHSQSRTPRDPQDQGGVMGADCRRVLVLAEHPMLEVEVISKLQESWRTTNTRLGGLLSGLVMPL